MPGRCKPWLGTLCWYYLLLLALTSTPHLTSRSPTHAQLRSHEVREAAARARVGVDKSDRATVEQAIDPRTRMVLFKMLNRCAVCGAAPGRQCCPVGSGQGVHG